MRYNSSMYPRILAAVRKLYHEYTVKQTVFVLRATVIALVIALLLGKRTFWTPDTLFAVLLAVAVVFGRTRAFLTRFLPLVSWLLLYEVFRGVANEVNHTVHYTEMINFDRWAFGGILPTVTLQAAWWQGTPSWYDYYFYFLYTIHFLMPFLLALAIWKYRPHLYWQFVVALVGLSFAAFTTYVLFPAAPPWMAHQDGYIAEQMTRISSDIWAAMGIKDFSEVYANLPTNPVAAVPSLHSAYPLLFSLFVVRIWGLRRSWWVFVYPISMWVGVVYLGEHYVFDVVLGALYAILAFVATIQYFAWHDRPRSLPGRIWARARSLSNGIKAHAEGVLR